MNRPLKTLLVLLIAPVFSLVAAIAAVLMVCGGSSKAIADIWK